MRVSMIRMRDAGRLIPVAGRQRLVGTLATKRFMGGDTWFKVLEFQELRSMPGQHQLYDPRVKECTADKPLIIFSGLAQESGAWVVQEWEVDVAPPQEFDSFASAWVKPARRNTAQGLGVTGRLEDHAEGPALNTSKGASRSSD